MSEGEGLPTLVFFTGPKGSGKDTAAKRLFTKWKGRHTHMNFADPLKEALGTIYGLDSYMLHDPIGKDEKLAEWPFVIPRVEMVELAKFIIQRNGGDFWARRWQQRVMNQECFYRTPLAGIAKVSPVVVCTDLRRPDELEVIKEFLGATDIRIYYVFNPRVEKARTAGQEAGDKMWLDDSEAHYAHLREVADDVVVNSGSIQDLYDNVDSVCKVPFPAWYEDKD